MADEPDPGRPSARPPRISPITGLPGHTAGESVASALRPKKRVLAPSSATESPATESPATEGPADPSSPDVGGQEGEAAMPPTEDSDAI